MGFLPPIIQFYRNTILTGIMLLPCTTALPLLNSFSPPLSAPSFSQHQPFSLHWSVSHVCAVHFDPSPYFCLSVSIAEPPWAWWCTLVQGKLHWSTGTGFVVPPGGMGSKVWACPDVQDIFLRSFFLPLKSRLFSFNTVVCLPLQTPKQLAVDPVAIFYILQNSDTF